MTPSYGERRRVCDVAELLDDVALLVRADSGQMLDDGAVMFPSACKGRAVGRMTTNKNGQASEHVVRSLQPATAPLCKHWNEGDEPIN